MRCSVVWRRGEISGMEVKSGVQYSEIRGMEIYKIG